VVLQRYDVRRLPPADPTQDLPRVRAYCETNHIDQAILGSGSERPEGGFAFRLAVYDRRTDKITLDRQGSSSGALDMFDTTDTLVASLLDGLSGTHLLFGSLTVDTDPPGATVSVNGRDAGQGPISLRGLPVGTVQLVARSAGREDAQASVAITDGETASASLKLARSMGKLSVQLPSDAQVTVASAEIGQKQITGPGVLDLPTGDYQLQAASPGLASVTGQITVGRNATASWLPWTKAYLVVQTVPDGAAVTVDGVARGAAPQLVEVDPGVPHHVELLEDKYETYRTDVRAAAGEKTILSPRLKGFPGSIQVNTSIAGAIVQLDDGPSGKTPYLFQSVQPGKHIVRIASLKVGNRLFTAGDPSEVAVNPGDAAVLSKTLVAGQGTLAITDAPPGSSVQIDGQDVNSEKALSSGIDLPAGWMDVTVRASTSQAWTGSALVPPGGSARLSTNSMTWQIPRRTISMKGVADDWSGLLPFWTSLPTAKDWKDQPGTHVARGFACRDNSNLFVRFEFSDGTPRKELSNELTEVDYLLVIFTNAGEVAAIAKLMRSGIGPTQQAAMSLRNPGSRSTTNLGDGRFTFRIGDNSLEFAVPLSLISGYVKKQPVEMTLGISDTFDSLFNNRQQTRMIDLGL
jgi:hypothetical protein